MKRGSFLAWTALLSCVAGCGDGQPPLDELSLRDALSCDPEVIAALTAATQQKLAHRLLDARLLAEAPRAIPFFDAATAPGPQRKAPAPAQLAQRQDVQRQQAGQDALQTGRLALLNDQLVIESFSAQAQRAPKQPLPLPLVSTDSPAATTAAQEAQALTGQAGAIVEDLVNTTGATTLQRVVGWPVAATVVDSTVYVNAAWLTALAALEGPASDSSNSAPGSAHSQRASSADPQLLWLADTTTPQRAAVHAASDPPPAEDPVPTEKSGLANPATGFGSCSSCSSSSCSSCSSPSCSSQSCDVQGCKSDGMGQYSCDPSACASQADKDCCRACGIATPAQPPIVRSLSMFFWLIAPLFYLRSATRRRKTAGPAVQAR